MRPAGRFEKIWNTGSYFRLNNFKNRIYQSCGGGKTEPQALPHLSCTLKPVLSCKLVRLVLCVPAQLNQEMVRGDTLCGLRREQQRVQQHHPSRCRPMSGRPPHRVRLASVRPSACLSGLRGVRVERLVYGMLLAREEGEEEKEDRRMWRGVESKHLLAVRWWDHWKLDFDEVEPLTLGGSSWGTLCGAKAASSAFSLSSASSSPLIRNSFTLLARVLGARDVVPMGSGGCDPSFPPRMSSETLFSTLENLPRAESYPLMLK